MFALKVFFISGLCSILSLLVLRLWAWRIDLVDRPNGRKNHYGEVPMVGGLAIAIGLMVGWLLLPDEFRPPVSYLLVALVFTLMGSIDDRFNLSPAVRLIEQSASTLLMIVVGSVIIRFIGSPFGFGPVVLESWLGAIFTMILVVGAVNAFNMIDGLDGLAGSLGFVALLGIAWVAREVGDVSVLGLSLVLAGALSGFLVFNWPSEAMRSLRTFMGDGGSMLIGFSLSWCLITLSQNSASSFAPVSLLWFVALPIFDMISTVSRRVARQQSPFSADTTHFHHLLLHRGMSSRQVLLILVALALFWAFFGFALEAWWDVPQWVSLLSFLAAGFVTDRLIRRGVAVPTQADTAGAD